jgi:hypothetical protein
MTVKERLIQLVEALPAEEAEQLKARLEKGRADRSGGEWPEAFLQSFGGWSDDPRSTEEIIREIYEGRSLSTRDTDL